MDARYIFDLVPAHQSSFRGTHAWRGVRTQTHTYASLEDGTPWLLFDNENDPGQRTNQLGSSDARAWQTHLHRVTAAFSAEHDAMQPWAELLQANGLVHDTRLG
jgi:hypothetical protein